MKKVINKINKKMQNVDLKQVLYAFIRCFLVAIISIINVVFLFLQLITAIIYLFFEKVTNYMTNLELKIKIKLLCKNKEHTPVNEHPQCRCIFKPVK
jgi:fructose-specific phosphotransferase system IIC component